MPANDTLEAALKRLQLFGLLAAIDEIRPRTPGLARVLELAYALGPAVLSGLGIGRGDIEEFVSELLSMKLHEIVASDDPRPFFWTCLRHKAISRQRKKATRVVADRPLDAPGETQTSSDQARLEARGTLEAFARGETAPVVDSASMTRFAARCGVFAPP